MTPTEFSAAITSLFGGYGAQSRAARALRVTDRTVRRYVSGDAVIPEGIAAEIEDLLKAFPEGAASLRPSTGIAAIHATLTDQLGGAGPAAGAILGAAIALARQHIEPEQLAALLADQPSSNP